MVLVIKLGLVLDGLDILLVDLDIVHHLLKEVLFHLLVGLITIMILRVYRVELICLLLETVEMVLV